ncbi:hypothetical protein Prudu_007322 [Prunus dulcis]|jgi:hypothetical protein
MKTK